MTHQVSLFGDKDRERADAIGRDLVLQLHSFARHHGARRPAIHVEGVQLGGNGAVTAQVRIDGRLVVVINRADVAVAARDLWTQFAGDSR